MIFDQRVVAGLRRDRVRLAAIAHDRPRQQDQHEDRDRGDDRQQDFVVEARRAGAQLRRLRLNAELAVDRHADACDRPIFMRTVGIERGIGDLRLRRSGRRGLFDRVARGGNRRRSRHRRGRGRLGAAATGA
jgi:hypothetical protein